MNQSRLVCAKCPKDASISCTCQNYPEVFCPDHILIHIDTISLEHSLSHLSMNDLCSKCNKQNSSYLCKCKGNDSILCKFCLSPHISQSPYTSHLVSQLYLS